MIGVAQAPWNTVLQRDVIQVVWSKYIKEILDRDFFVRFSGYLRRAKSGFFELGNFQTELDQLLRRVRPFFGSFWLQIELFLGENLS